MGAKWPEFLVGPERLRAYYVRIASRSPGKSHWTNGVQVSERWLELQRRQGVTQSDIDALLHRMQAEPRPGSAWSIMLDQFTCWAAEQGFAV